MEQELSKENKYLMIEKNIGENGRPDSFVELFLSDDGQSLTVRFGYETWIMSGPYDFPIGEVKNLLEGR